MNTSNAIPAFFGAIIAVINGICDCIGAAYFRFTQGVAAIFSGLEVLLDHRVTSMVIWVTVAAVQDILKDSDVQTLIASPASIKSWDTFTYVYIAGKALIPTFIAIQLYKSDTWARKGRTAAGIAQPQDFSGDPKTHNENHASQNQTGAGSTASGNPNPNP